MFFNLILLNRQHQARFGYAWIAATRGIQHINRKDVLAVDIDKLCEEIAVYVCSESNSPRSRFSLRLSVVLINGTLKIHRQKAVYFMEELFKFMTSISRPTFIEAYPRLEESGMFLTPPSPVPRKKGKKRRLPSDASTPQSQIERIVSSIVAKESLQVEVARLEPLVFQARSDEVTLHEGQLAQQVAGGEFGTLGVLPTEEELLREISRLEERRPLSLQPIEEVPEPFISGISQLQPPEPPRKPIRLPTSSSSSEPEVGPVTLTVTALVHAPADMEISPVPQPIITQEPHVSPIQPSEVTSEVPPISRIEQAPVEEIIVEVPQVPVEPVTSRTVLAQMQEEAVMQRDKKIAPRKKKVDKDLEKLLVSTKPTRFVRINRCEPEEVEWIDINPCPLPQFKLKTPNLTKLLDMYVMRTQIDLHRLQKVSEGSLEVSGTARKKSGQLTPPAELSGNGRVVPPIPEIRVSEVVQRPSEVRVSIPEDVLVETLEVVTESRVEAGRPLMASTPVRRKSTDVEQRTTEQVMAAPAEHLMESPRKKRRLFVDVEPQPQDLDFITLPSGLISRELTSEAVVIPQESADSIPFPLVTNQERQQDIVNKVFVRGGVTLEDVCQRPITKLTIARAFNDVLVLCKHKYVTLIPEDDSSELKLVERGLKMTL